MAQFAAFHAWAAVPEGMIMMLRTAPCGIAILALAGAALAPAISSAEDMPAFWAVTGVTAGDVLHLRDMPSADSKSLAGIPPDARGLKHIGCRRNELPFDTWVRLSKEARQAALTQWCRIEYRGVEGWVAGRYLKRDDGKRH
jgi:hypothetical protein